MRFDSNEVLYKRQKLKNEDNCCELIRIKDLSYLSISSDGIIIDDCQMKHDFRNMAL